MFVRDEAAVVADGVEEFGLGLEHFVKGELDGARGAAFAHLIGCLERPTADG